ncbi:hypothetical protein BH09ACT7_BH09ACT7_16100 [soil metagenome]
MRGLRGNGNTVLTLHPAELAPIALPYNEIQCGDRASPLMLIDGPTVRALAHQRKISGTVYGDHVDKRKPFFFIFPVKAHRCIFWDHPVYMDTNGENQEPNSAQQQALDDVERAWTLIDMDPAEAARLAGHALLNTTNRTRATGASLSQADLDRLRALASIRRDAERVPPDLTQVRKLVEGVAAILPALFQAENQTQ